MKPSTSLTALLVIAVLPCNVLGVAFPQWRFGRPRYTNTKPTWDDRWGRTRPPSSPSSTAVPTIVPGTETAVPETVPTTGSTILEPTLPTTLLPTEATACSGRRCSTQQSLPSETLTCTGTTCGQPTTRQPSTFQSSNSATTSQSQQPTGTITPNNCGSGSGGIQVQWTGDVVSYSWPRGSCQTEGCLDLTGFEGQVAIGGEDGTILEVNPSNYLDISYILGFSVPVVCTGNGAVTGCNKDLFGNGGREGQVQKNPTGPGGSRDPGAYQGCASCVPWCYACSAADPFFAPCAGSAYVYPYDDFATIGPATAVTCCVGTNCPSSGREGRTAGGNPQPERVEPCELCSGVSKRSVDQLEEVMGRWEREFKPVSPSLLARGESRHRRHAHGYGHRSGGSPYSPILAEIK